MNYYGTKRMLQVLRPLLKPKSRSVGVSSTAGQLGASGKVPIATLRAK